MSYYPQFAGPEANGAGKNVLMVYANYDLTFPKEYSLQVVDAFRRYGVRFEPRVLPCGHYTTGETPYKFIDGWYMGWFVYRAFKALREEKEARAKCRAVRLTRSRRGNRLTLTHGSLGLVFWCTLHALGSNL